MSTAEHSDISASSEETAPPRIRWAAIVWGLFFAAVAVTGLVSVSDPVHRGDIADAVMGLTPGVLIATALLIVGVLVLLTGVAGLARRAQRRLAAQRDGAEQHGSEDS